MLKQVGVRLEEELIKKVKIACLEKDIPFQEAVRQSLENWLKQSDNRDS